MDEVIIPKFVVDSRILHQLIDWGLSDEIIRVFTAFQSYQKKIKWYRISSIRIGSSANQSSTNRGFDHQSPFKSRELTRPSALAERKNDSAMASSSSRNDSLSPLQHMQESTDFWCCSFSKNDFLQVFTESNPVKGETKALLTQVQSCSDNPIANVGFLVLWFLHPCIYAHRPRWFQRKWFLLDRNTLKWSVSFAPEF